MVDIKRILETNKKLKYLNQKEAIFLKKMEDIAQKPIYVKEWNKTISEMPDFKKVMPEAKRHQKVNTALDIDDKEKRKTAMKFLRHFELIQPNPDCKVLSVYYEY